jgi:tetratricopeptide (TPR) repeat protein
LAGVAVVLTPVAVRNAYVGGGFYVTTSQAGPNFYIGNNPRADGTYQSLRYGRGAPEYERQDATELAEHALGRTLTPAEVSSFWSGRAFDFIASQPIAWLELTMRKVALLVNAAEVVDTESQESHAEWSLPLRLLGVIGHFGLLVPLACFGIVATWSSRSRLWLLYAMTAAYAVSVVAFYVFARYRFPLVPFLMLFAAAGLVALPDVVRTRAVPGGMKAAAAIAVTAVIANWPILSKSLMIAITETNLAVALQAKGQPREAVNHYQRAIAIQPDYAPAYNNLGVAERASGDVDKAIDAYRRAVAMKPGYPDAHYNLANTLVDQGRQQRSNIFIAAGRTRFAEREETRHRTAANGKADEAMAGLAQRSSQIWPAKAHCNLGDCLRQRRPTPSFTFDAGRARRATAISTMISAACFWKLYSDGSHQKFRAAFAITLTPADRTTWVSRCVAGKIDDAIAESARGQAASRISDAQKNRDGFARARGTIAPQRHQHRSTCATSISSTQQLGTTCAAISATRCRSDRAASTAIALAGSSRISN